MITETVMIYFDDLDAMGVVHNGRYVIVFERALGAYWTRAGWPYDPGQPRFAEVFFVVRENTITYHVPISRAWRCAGTAVARASWHHERCLRIQGLVE